tara:strand:+ start:246 stop:635 length:390 start_codon:yes stop_codon:yes gene_type:complete
MLRYLQCPSSVREESVHDTVEVVEVVSLDAVLVFVQDAEELAYLFFTRLILVDLFQQVVALKVLLVCHCVLIYLMMRRRSLVVDAHYRIVELITALCDSVFVDGSTFQVGVDEPFFQIYPDSLLCSALI